MVDVGANIGQFAVWAADVLGAEHIACVEPLPGAVVRLREVVPRLAPCRVDVVVAALGSTAGRRILMSRRRPTAPRCWRSQPPPGGDPRFR